MPEAIPAAAPEPVASPTPEAPKVPKGFDPTGRGYASYEEFANAWKNTKTYLRLPTDKRVNSFDEIKSRWQMAQDEKTQAAIDQPDLFGRLNVKAGELGQEVAGPVGKFAAQAVVPSSNAQAAIDAALFAAGGPLGDIAGETLAGAPAAIKFMSRVGVPAVAGALGGATSGHPVSGALSGVTQGVAGEAISATLGIARRAMQRADVSAIGDWLGEQLGIDKARFNTATKLRDELVSGTAQEGLEAKVAKISGKVPRAALTVDIDPDLARALKISGGRTPFDFKAANDTLETLERIGWDTHFRTKNTLLAQKARSAVHQMEGTMAEAIDKVDPKLAQQWYTARGQLRLSRMMSNLFREPGVLEGGQVNIPKLQELLTNAGPDGYKTDLEQVVGPVGKKSIKNLLGIARRGGEAGAIDVPGQAPRLGISYHIGLPHPWMTGVGKFPRHVGYQPFDLGRGRAFTGAMVLGAHQFVNNLQNLPDDANKDAAGVNP